MSLCSKAWPCHVHLLENLNISGEPQYLRGNPPIGYFLDIFGRFSRFWRSGNGLKMLLGPVRSFSRSRFLISSILDPFRLIFCILGRPLYCVFLQERDLVFLQERDLVFLEDRDSCCSQQREFLYVCKRQIVVLKQQEIQSKSFISPLW